MSRKSILYGSVVHISNLLKVNRIDGLTTKVIEIGGCAKTVKINGDLIVVGKNCASCLKTNDPDISVDISGSNPPIPGQILVATSFNTAQWVNGGGGGSSGNIAYQLSSVENRTIGITYVPITYLTWISSLYATYTNGIIAFEVVIPTGSALDLRIRGVNTGVLLDILNINSSQFISQLLTTIPSINDRIVIEIRSANGLSIRPKIFGITLQFTQ